MYIEDVFSHIKMIELVVKVNRENFEVFLLYGHWDQREDLWCQHWQKFNGLLDGFEKKEQEIFKISFGLMIWLIMVKKRKDQKKNKNWSSKLQLDSANKRNKTS